MGKISQTNKRQRKARQIVAKRLADKSRDPLADIALFGSVVGNVLQAIEQANLSNDLNSAKAALVKVTAEKDYLIRLLRD